MRKFLRLIGIGITSGIILAVLMQLVFALTGNEAYILLYNVDYFPLIHIFKGSASFGFAFHLVFCIASVVSLFYVLTFFEWQYSIWPYVAVYTAGSGALYFLTMLTEKPPAADDEMAWFFWTASHFVFSIAVGLMINRFVKSETDARV